MKKILAEGFTEFDTLENVLTEEEQYEVDYDLFSDDLDEAKKKKKPYSSMTYTTGSPELNLRHFNKMMGTTDNYNPSTEEAKANKAAEDAAKAIGTISAASPDGSSSVSAGEGSGESAGGEGGGMGESLELKEMMGDRYRHYIEATKRDFPELVKETQDKLDKSESKAEDYAILSVFYSKLLDLAFDKWDDASELFTDDNAMMPMPESVGKQFCNMLFDIKNLEPLYDLDIYEGFSFIQDFMHDPTNEDYENFFADCLDYGKEMFDEELDEAKEKEIPENAKKIDYVDYKHSYAHALEPKLKVIQMKVGVENKPASYIKGIIRNTLQNPDIVWTEKEREFFENVMAKTDAKDIYYYVKNAINKAKETFVYVDEDGELIRELNEGFETVEKLTEDKRAVRKYYARPQNKWLGNKAELLKFLTELGDDENCTIYTLNNLEDNTDVHELTNNDIIYYYDDGKLYDKNKVKILDYDLYIKHEEERKKVNTDDISDATFKDIYNDRMTKATELEEAAIDRCTDRQFIVYCHTNKINGKKYIGITTQQEGNRWRSGKGYERQKFYRAILKYGWENFSHEIIADGLTLEEAKALEQKLIAKYHTYINDPQSNGYNASLGGEANLKYLTAEEKYQAQLENGRKSYQNNREKRLDTAKQDYWQRPEFYAEKSHAQYLKHRDQRLANDKEYQASLKDELDLIRKLNKVFPNRISKEDEDKMINFRNCRNKPYLDNLLANFSDSEISDILSYDDRMTEVTVVEDWNNEGRFSIAGDEEIAKHIKVLPRADIEKAVEELKPEERFEVGYAHGLNFGKRLRDKFTLVKCVIFTGYTGVDYRDVRSAENEQDQIENRVNIANKQIATGDKNIRSKVDRYVRGDAYYDQTNKVVRQWTTQEADKDDPTKMVEISGNTLLFYPDTKAMPDVKYLLDLKDGKGYFKVSREDLKETIYKRLEEFIKSEGGSKYDSVFTKLDKELMKVGLDTDNVTSGEKELAGGNKFEYSVERVVEKPQVRALYTDNIYYFKTPYVTYGTPIVEELKEEKDNEFDLAFTDINVYGEALEEGLEKGGTCCICGGEIEDYGNNPEPYMSGENGNRCCDACNFHYVLPARLEQGKEDVE